MWILFLICIVPLIICGVFSKRAWLIYLLLAGVLLIIIIPLIPITEHIYIKHHASVPEEVVNESYSVIFFNWEILDGFDLWRSGVDVSPTSFQHYLRDSGVSPELAERMDITNPTPFHVFLWLLLLAMISFIFKSKTKKTSNATSDQELNSDDIPDK